MSLEPLEPVDTRALFRPVSQALVTLLRGLPPADWRRPTIAGAWVVRDIVAHLLDTALRRLSFHRDGMTPPPPPVAIESERDFVRFINALNASWIDSSKRLSPRVLTDLYAGASRELAEWFEAVPLDAPALFAVSWAGEESSAGWFDIGREFTEVWHHQQQIRMAVGAEPLADPRYLGAVIDVAVRGLPHAYRSVFAASETTVLVDIDGPSGGQWTLCRDDKRWTLWRGRPTDPTASVRVGDHAAWQLLFNALPAAAIADAVRTEGPAALCTPLMRARSVIV